MTRTEFLAHVGDPNETARRVVALREDALRLWATIRPSLYRKDGKTLRAGMPSPEVERVRRDVDRLYGEANALALLGGRQQHVYDDPWSHTRADLVRLWGLEPSTAAEGHVVE